MEDELEQREKANEKTEKMSLARAGDEGLYIVVSLVPVGATSRY